MKAIELVTSRGTCGRADKLDLSIPVFGADGSSSRETVTACSDGQSVFVTGSGGKEHLVCELMQLAGGRVPQSVTDACAHDPTFDPVDVSGWCHSTDPMVSSERCATGGAVHFFGAAEPRTGSTVHTVCVP